MLTITDLHNEQELSAFEMGKLEGGAISKGDAVGALAAAGTFFKTLKCDEAVQVVNQAAWDIANAGPIVTPI